MPQAWGYKVAFIGESGAGKGTLMKEMLAKHKKPRKILSTVNDYGKDAQMYFTLEDLLESCNLQTKKEVKDHIIVIDEAQVWLPREFKDLQKKYTKLLILLANARKFNNTIVFLTHGFNQLPVWLPTYLNGIERFKTSENLRTQAARFPQFPQLIKSFIDKPVMKLHERIYIHL